MKVERKDIVLNCIIAARVYGGLAIHKGVGRHAKGYTLTHIQSSSALVTGIDLPIAEQDKTLVELASVMDWTLSHDEIASIWLHNEQVKLKVQDGFKKFRREDK
jgi:hypothetical protein